MICLPLPQIIGDSMFIFAYVVGALIVASTVFALLVPSGPEVNLSDMARKMEKIHRDEGRSFK